MRRRQMFAAITAAEESRAREAVSVGAQVSEILATVSRVLDAPSANACPKCGRELKARGAHFHIRACNG